MDDGATPALAKRSVDDLALFGGSPAFSRPLHVGRPNIGDRTAFFARLERILDERLLTNGGPFVNELEDRIATQLDVRNALVVNNATIGLQIAARAAGLSGQVIVPSFTFIATAHALEWIGLEPVFGDIEPGRLCLDPEAAEPLIGPRTSGIVATHLWGRTADVEGLTELARRHGLTLLFDAAHAYGCARDGVMVGGFGDAEVFSFHATKFVNAFEGGVITTNDDDLAERVRTARNFGFSGWDRTVSAGTNGKMHEASAAMALTSLDAMDEFVAVNHRNFRLYSEHLAGVAGISVLSLDDRGACNAQHVILQVDGTAGPIGRDRLQQVLKAENVLARRYFHPGCHRMVPYVHRTTPVTLPVTEAIADEVLVMPTGTAVGPTEIAAIAGLIAFASRNGHTIEQRQPAVPVRT